MVKIKNLAPSTLFVHDKYIYMRLADDFPHNAVKMATGEVELLTGVKLQDDAILGEWNELHAEMARVIK